MDFVIVGFALGSLFLLLGVAARDLGPRLLAKPQPTSSLSADPTALPGPQIDLWRKLTPLAGPTMMIGGAVILLATLAGIFFQVSDSQGIRLVLGAFLISVVGLAIRLPMLANARPKPPKRPRASKPKLEQRRPAPVRERPRPARARRPEPSRAERPQPVRRRPEPEPEFTYQQPGNGQREEPSEQAEWAAIRDLPDIFGSDEPIQTGLLEKLLAEDDARSRSVDPDSQDGQRQSNNGYSSSGGAPRSSASGRSAG